MGGMLENFHWLQALVIASSVTIVALVSRRMIRTPTRPENDPYADAEFGENGVLKKPGDEENP